MRNVILVLPLLLLLSGCLKQELQTGLSEQDAQQIIVLLKEHGIEAQRQVVVKEREAPSWTVYVRGGSQTLVAAWRILAENGLPREKVKGLDEVFSGGGMIPTASEEKAKLLVGLQGEITRTLKAIEGVTDVRVQVVIPENSPLLDKSQWSPPTASVLMKGTGSQPPIKEDQVKALVSRSVEGLSPENVAVVYQKIEPAKPEVRDIGWYLANDEILVAALVLLVLVMIAALALLVQVRRMKSQNTRLRNELAAATQKPMELTAQGTR